MKWFFVLSCLLLMSTWHRVCMGNPFIIGKVVFDNAMGLYDNVQKLEGDKSQGPSLKTVDAQLLELSNDFQAMRNDIMNKISNDLKDKLTEVTNEFFHYTKDIEFKYQRFMKFLKNPNKYERDSILTFAHESTSTNPEELENIMERLYDVFVGKDFRETTLLSIITKKSTANDLVCIKQQSKQQMISDLYKAFVDSSTKGLIVVLYSYDTLAKLENKKYREEQNDAKDMFATRTNYGASYYISSIKAASREVWKCDPEQQIRTVTYDKVQLYQGYFMNELDAFVDGKLIYGDFIRIRMNSCDKMKDVFLNCWTEICHAQPRQRRCEGHIRNCEAMPNWFQICHSAYGSGRRYDWMRENMDKNEADYGTFHEHCNDTQGLYGGTFTKDDLCLCTCESNAKLIDRYFSLRSVLSDMDENKVVTGAKLVIDGNVFHITIQQGVLGPNGTIIGDPEWLMVYSITESDLNSTKVVEIQKHDMEFPKRVWTNNFKKNDLVYTLTEQTHRVNLDTLDAGPKRVVTGVRFQRADNNLRLEIRSTPFDYTTGKLDERASSWVFNKNGNDQRKELKLSHPHDPLQVDGSNEVISSHNQFLDFTTTDMKKDLGQQMVPFIDLQKVTTTPLMPVAGVGLVVRGQQGSGGFLAPEVSHFDYTDYL